MSDAPVVWAIADPRGRVIGPVFEHHDDAMHDCESRNQMIRERHVYMHGNYCTVQAFAFIPDTIK